MRPGQTYQLMTENRAGHLMQAGSVRVAVGTTARTDMMTAMNRDSIAALVVDDQHGHRLAEIAVTSWRTATWAQPAAPGAGRSLM
jgi:hypothetical protein